MPPLRQPDTGQRGAARLRRSAAGIPNGTTLALFSPVAVPLTLARMSGPM
jgi:hypothetical protein